ncbi:MAG TPA: zinc ribbon domain-containing protein [Terriglobales bacterium]|nr:zinc ribbon domain-containing protein [Terriglobales bacterium]
MFCDACGTQLQTNQQHCSGCGKAISGTIIGYPRRSRIQEHVRLLAILWFAFSAFEIVGGIVLMILANTLFVHLAEQSAADSASGGSPLGFLHPLMTVVALFVLAKAAAGFLAGWGLLNREPWGRVLALVLGFIALIHVPLGTALGVYTLWVLLPANSEAEYDHYSAANAA